MTSFLNVLFKHFPGLNSTNQKNTEKLSEFSTDFHISKNANWYLKLRTYGNFLKPKHLRDNFSEICKRNGGLKFSHFYRKIFSQQNFVDMMDPWPLMGIEIFMKSC